MCDLNKIFNFYQLNQIIMKMILNLNLARMMKKFIDKELSNMSMKKFVDKETQTDGFPSAMRRLYPSLPSKGEIIEISSNDSDYLYL